MAIGRGRDVIIAGGSNGANHINNVERLVVCCTISKYNQCSIYYDNEIIAKNACRANIYYIIYREVHPSPAKCEQTVEVLVLDWY